MSILLSTAATSRDLVPAEPNPAFVSRMVALSSKTFAAAPQLEGELGHLRRLINDNLAQYPDWIVFTATGTGGRMIPGLRLELSKDYLSKPLEEAVETLFHEAQHDYDRAGMNARRKRVGGMPSLFPLEAEIRGFKAGCAFRDAAAAAGLAPPLGEAERARCAGDIGPFYACGNDWSVESFFKNLLEEKKNGRSLADIEEALSPRTESNPPGPEDWKSALYGILNTPSGLHEDCVQLERFLNGNPLNDEGSPPTWSVKECLERAKAVVLDPAWKSTKESCSLPKKWLPDARAAAKEF